MALASVDPAWLHTIGLIAGTLLLLELLVALTVVLVLSAVLALGLWWLREHVVPILEQYGGQARQVMEMTTQGTDRIVQGVAEFQGRKQAAQTILRVLFFGKQSATPMPRVPVGTAQQGVRQTRGISSIEGYAPQDLPVDPTRSTRDITSADLTPLTGER